MNKSRPPVLSDSSKALGESSTSSPQLSNSTRGLLPVTGWRRPLRQAEADLPLLVQAQPQRLGGSLHPLTSIQEGGTRQTRQPIPTLLFPALSPPAKQRLRFHAR